MENQIPWSIRPTDCFGRDIAIGDKVAFIVTNYQDRFKKIYHGIIIGFTEEFIKIKPDDEYKDEWENELEFKRYKKEKRSFETANFVLRIPRRVILL